MELADEALGPAVDEEGHGHGEPGNGDDGEDVEEYGAVKLKDPRPAFPWRQGLEGAGADLVSQHGRVREELGIVDGLAEEPADPAHSPVRVGRANLDPVQPSKPAIPCE